MSKLLRKTLSECKLSAEQKLDLSNLAKRPDSKIDCSGIPELTEDFWKNARQNPFLSGVRKSVKKTSKDD